MKRVSLENVQARLGDYVKASMEQPVLILRDGEPVAMLVGLEQHAKRTPLKLRDVLKRAWKDFEEHGGIPMNNSGTIWHGPRTNRLLPDRSGREVNEEMEIVALGDRAIARFLVAGAGGS